MGGANPLRASPRLYSPPQGGVPGSVRSPPQRGVLTQGGNRQLCALALRPGATLWGVVSPGGDPSPDGPPDLGIARIC